MHILSDHTIATFHCSNFTDYLDLCLRWCHANHFVIFRGAGNLKYPLLPGIARTAKTEMTVNRIGEVQEIEQLIFEEFLTLRARTIKEEGIREQDLLETLCLAQHFGLPTRLLDWSSNPLVALWFAVNSALRNKSKQDICVWAYCIAPGDVRVIDPRNQREIRQAPFSINRTYIFKPLHITDRIHVQAGWFTLHHCHRGKGYIPLEENPEYQPELAKIIIPAENFEQWMLHLDILHINNSVLFPGIDGSCEHLRWKVLRRYQNFE